MSKEDLAYVDLLFVKNLDEVLASSKSLTDDEFTLKYGETHTLSI